jgi:uncharacterized membrane protein YjjP (DUF1212 family)
MKTPVQNLKDRLQSINERYVLKEDANWLMNEVIDLVENTEEEEKVHIMMAFNDGKINAVLKKINSEEYYNKNYKQNE